MAEGLANLLLSIALVRKVGLIGVAWGTVIPHAISTAVIIPLYTLHTLKMSWSDYVAKAFVRPIICAIPIAGLCYVFSHLIESPTWIVFGAEVITVCWIFGITSYFICLTAEQRAVVLNKLKMLIVSFRQVSVTPAGPPG